MAKSASRKTARRASPASGSRAEKPPMVIVKPAAPAPAAPAAPAPSAPGGARRTALAKARHELVALLEELRAGK